MPHITHITHRLIAFGLVVMWLPASAAGSFRCTLEMNGANFNLDFAPQADPYTVKAVDIGEHFRFKAVVIGNTQQVEHIKTYAYYRTPRQPVLLHSAHYIAPQAGFVTGTHFVYSPRLERELKYACVLQSAPS
jgi:hypothetical protein